jgi:N-acetyl sugar amidotransferase
MDTSDPNITFDDKGVCNHCTKYFTIMDRYFSDTQAAQDVFTRTIAQIKSDGKGRKYDCVIGVSGGVDSTYVAWKVKEIGLRPLAVHLDNGWDSELAVHNIEKVLKNLDIDLFTYVIDWEEFKDLQISFLKASTPDIEIPSDHAIVATLYRAAAKVGVKYIIRGANIATECILPGAWSQGHSDWKYIKNIHKKFSARKLHSFPQFSFLGYAAFKYFRGIRDFNILNYLPFNKQEAMDLIQQQLGWQNYGGKHYESIYTRFYQGYILPVKFGFDKRRAHLSTLVCSKQILREEALAQMASDPYPSEEMKQQDKEYVIKKLRLTEKEFEEIMKTPPKKFSNYPSYATTWWYKAIWGAYKKIKRIP